LVSLSTKEELKLMVFENRVLRRIFEPKREEATRGGGWRKLCNKEAHTLFSSPDVMMGRSKRMR
jgi:hypothetical protein